LKRPGSLAKDLIGLNGQGIGLPAPDGGARSSGHFYWQRNWHIASRWVQPKTPKNPVFRYAP